MVNPKTLLFLLAFLFLSRLLYGQNDNNANYDPSEVNHIYQQVKAYERYLNAIKERNTELLDKPIRKEYAAIITQKNNELLNQINGRGFLFDSIAYPFLTSVFTRVIDKNHLNRDQFHFFCDRTGEVNAYSFEDGTIVCNLGLVNMVENEAQLAMVFCHELAHYLLKDVNNSIAVKLERYHSPEFMAKMRAVKRENSGAKKQLEDLLITDVFDKIKHNRAKETAADSLGMLLYNNTGYNCTSIPHLFDLLDSAGNKRPRCQLKDFFRKQNIVIEDDWLATPKKMNFGKYANQEYVDSLKTHPDCLQRKKVIEAYFSKNPCNGNNFLIADQRRLKEVQKRALFDEAEYAKENQNLGFYLFQLIQNDLQYTGDRYIKTEIFNTFSSLYDHFKAHSLASVVNLLYVPENDNDEYAKLLALIDNINLDTMGFIAATYYQNNRLQITASAATINKIQNLKH